MKIAFVFIADGKGNFFHGKPCVFKKKGRLGKPLFLQMLGVGLACSVFYLVTEPIEIVM